MAIALLSSDHMSDRQTGYHLTLPRLCDMDTISAILQRKRQEPGHLFRLCGWEFSLTLCKPQINSVFNAPASLLQTT